MIEAAVMEADYGDTENSFLHLSCHPEEVLEQILTNMGGYCRNGDLLTLAQIPYFLRRVDDGDSFAGFVEFNINPQKITDLNRAYDVFSDLMRASIKGTKDVGQFYNGLAIAIMFKQREEISR